jgi:hypothetical protein
VRIEEYEEEGREKRKEGKDRGGKITLPCNKLFPQSSFPPFQRPHIYRNLYFQMAGFWAGTASVEYFLPVQCGANPGTALTLHCL